MQSATHVKQKFNELAYPDGTRFDCVIGVHTLTARQYLLPQALNEATAIYD